MFSGENESLAVMERIWFLLLQSGRGLLGRGGGIPVFYSDCQLRDIREGGRR